MDFSSISLVPGDYKDKDPRTLPFLYPESINLVSYAKRVQTFYFFNTLEVAEDIAKKQGFILLPWSCIHWERAKLYGADRKVKIGRKSFFMMKLDELTKGEKKKLQHYIEDIRA